MSRQKILWMGEKGVKAMKSRQESAVKYKKGVVVSNKIQVQEVLDASVIIELIEQSSYDDGLEGMTVRFRFKNDV